MRSTKMGVRMDAKRISRQKKNKDLWLRLMNLYKHHHVKLVWVKGHAGHPLNERCDQLAVKASKDKANWKIDSVFEMEESKGLL